jgi:teichuronic acid biosynthesis glycosyltransferase TuaC
VPAVPAAPAVVEPPVLVTVGHLIARKRHADVVRALAALRDRQPALRYRVIGDGPERAGLARLAAELGVAERVELLGQLPHTEAVARAREASLFVMPSEAEAFGVAYVEAMAAGLPAIAARGEPGPQEIAAAGDGIRLVPAGDAGALAATIDGLVGDRATLRGLGAQARATVERAFTWERCGRETVRAYEDALR